MDEVGKSCPQDKTLEAFEQVANDEINAIIFGFEELFLLTNEKLPEEKKIKIDDFLTWLNETGKDKNVLYEGILQIYNRAKIEQKKAFVNFLVSSPSNWQKYAWLLERKFSDMNLQHKIDLGGTKKIIIERANESDK